MGYEIIPLRLVWGMKDLMLQGYGIYGHVEPFALKQRPHFQPPALKCGECKGNRLQQWTEQFGLVKEYSEPANPYLCAADYNAAWYMEQFTSQYRLA